MLIKHLLCVSFRLDTGDKRMNATLSLLKKLVNKHVYSIYSASDTAPSILHINTSNPHDHPLR